MAKRERRVAMPGREMPRHVGELIRSGALEGEDRLLLVADRKNAARLRLAHPLPGRELGGEPADDLPLRRGCILPPRDPHPVEAPTALVTHPSPPARGEPSPPFCGYS